MEPSEKVRVYDRGVRVTTEDGILKSLVDHRTGDMRTPKLDEREARGAECEHFRECVRFSKSPLSSATAGLSDVRLLEAAPKSIASGGARVAV
jgi:hypothetical protein